MAYLEMVFVLPIILSIPVFIWMFDFPFDPTFWAIIALVLFVDLAFSRMMWKRGSWEILSEEDGQTQG